MRETIPTALPKLDDPHHFHAISATLYLDCDYSLADVPLLKLVPLRRRFCRRPAELRMPVCTPKEVLKVVRELCRGGSDDLPAFCPYG